MPALERAERKAETANLRLPLMRLFKCRLCVWGNSSRTNGHGFAKLKRSYAQNNLNSTNGPDRVRELEAYTSLELVTS